MNQSLENYQQKRNFKQTPEPKGRIKKSENKLRFVIHRHAATRLHYDFRLEIKGVLKSWAVPKGPSLNPLDKRLSIMVEDHPFSYRSFEGTIPKGNYGAGEVEIWDKGYYEPVEKQRGKTDDAIMQHGLNEESLRFILYGEKLQGEFSLIKVDSIEPNAWLLHKHNDQYAVTWDYNAEDFTSEDSKVTAHLKDKASKKKLK
ncbi:3'-phosphoesterase [Elizabethkingia anophelis]|uniref:DNA polymerase ligase N-terminal domain-containing protein n=1 Tax=Elizabethkingia anophelis TaxID=1117645 RepID=UPI000C6E1AE3|nr:DNA polymerase ligase N-terminal domain-containing protein [Elizabethkingia anophelis]MDV3508375.1 3'-phosphoesterase [Elizabethkingia anophelis]MDV3541211.1 3'-phosphoesterase [Elizabethkingia anophelis]MDV3854935.1 3'-phosphoesterase [Elizabethkingia anophelis]MDV3860814.1 3'-phosphoesterase [Elizabethkingia anophelis]MDV3909262.1 3'-phosphoesterase [Elizabethkingia anophelis]